MRMGTAARAILLTVAASSRLAPSAAHSHLSSFLGGWAPAPSSPRARATAQEAFCVQLSPPVTRWGTCVREWLTLHAARAGARVRMDAGDDDARPPFPPLAVGVWGVSPMNLKGGTEAR
ncbi:hypothetical protein T484DRAFT_1920169, partial [Baffinella frigidus]